MAKTKPLGRRRVTANVCIDGDLLARLDAAAQREGVSRSGLLGRILKAALDTEESPEANGTETSAPEARERIPWDEVKGRFGQ